MHFNLPGRLPEFALDMWLASLWRPSGQAPLPEHLSGRLPVVQHCSDSLFGCGRAFLPGHEPAFRTHIPCGAQSSALLVPASLETRGRSRRIRRSIERHGPILFDIYCPSPSFQLRRRNPGNRCAYPWKLRPAHGNTLPSFLSCRPSSGLLFDSHPQPLSGKRQKPFLNALKSSNISRHFPLFECFHSVKIRLSPH